MSFLSKRIILFTAITGFLVNGITAQPEKSSSSAESVQPAKTEQTLPDQKPKAKVSDYFVAFGEEALIELFGSAFVNLTSSKPVGIKFDDIIYSITKQPYIWDNTSFAQNQIVHPYIGNLFFNSARANNIDFWTAALYTAWGAWSWENIYQNFPTSYNDMITTTAAGIVTGEAFHRLSYIAGALWEPLLWVISPIDGINRLLRGTNYRNTAPSTFDMIYRAEVVAAFSAGQNYKNGGKPFVPLFEIHPYVVYQNPFSHKTKEPFDQFSVDAFLFTNIQETTGCIDINGSLYSWPFMLNTDLPSSLGITLNYKVNYFDQFNYSKSGTGFFVRQQIPFDRKNPDKNFMWWNLEANFIFLEASKVVKTNYYNFGPEVRLDLGFELNRFTIRTYSEFDYSFPQNIWHNKSFCGIDFEILPWLYISVEDLVVCKKDDIRNFTSIGVKFSKIK